MRLLGYATYDPAAAVNKSLASLQAMTALDTSNLRATFVAPDSGTVLVRLKAVTRGSATGAVLFGVLDGATVKGRISPLGTRNLSGSGSGRLDAIGTFVVSGLTPGTTYNWDFAMSVELAVASSNLSYGGPNDSTVNNAWGAATISIWEPRGLIAGKLHDPATAVVSSSVGSLAAITAVDTTNLRHTFTGPGSGVVLVRQQFCISGTTALPEILCAILEGATVKGRTSPRVGLVNVGVQAAGDHIAVEALSLIPAASGSSFTWDAAYGVEAVAASGVIKYGGPDDATTDNAWGGYAYEIWDAAEPPPMIGLAA